MSRSFYIYFVVIQLANVSYSGLMCSPYFKSMLNVIHANNGKLDVKIVKRLNADIFMSLVNTLRVT